MIADINELNQIQNVSAANKESMAVALCLIDDGVIITDVEGRVILINEVAEALTGWYAEEANGRPLDEVLHIIDEATRMSYCNSQIGVLGEDKSSGNTMLISRDGKRHIVTDKRAPVYNKDGNIMGFVLILCDITEKRRIEAKLLKAQELENINLIAIDMVHKFNNILTVIMGNISLAKKHANYSDKIYEKLTEVEHASIQAKSLMQRLRNFSRENLEKKVAGMLD